MLYIVLEYLAYLCLVAILGAVMFLASATLLITKEGAKRVADSSRKLAQQAAHLVAKHVHATSELPPPPSQPGESS